jgi:hypothetical protein
MLAFLKEGTNIHSKTSFDSIVQIAKQPVKGVTLLVKPIMKGISAQ